MNATISKNQKKQTKENEQEEFTMRPLDLKKDYEELLPFYDMIFEKELSAKGTTIKATLDEMISFMPLIKFIGVFSKDYKHAFDGFIYENSEGKIVSTVNIGYSGNYWEIAMVATHPDYRRKGLARKLVSKSIDHAKLYGAKMCVLEVLEENHSAYNLYTSEGFYHFDTQMKMKLAKEKLAATGVKEFPEGYILKKKKQDRKTGKGLYELDVRATPKDVQNYLPISLKRYQKPLLIRLMRPLVKLFIRSKMQGFTVHYEGTIVCNLFVGVGRSEGDCNKIDLMIDPVHRKKLAGALISQALEYLKENAKHELTTVIMLRKSDEEIVKTLEKTNFEIFETNHMLGLKLED